MSKEQEVPRLVFEVHNDDSLFIGCSWPDSQTEAEAKKVIEAYATMVYLIVSAKILPGIQHAISNHKNTDPKNGAIAKAILFHIQKAMQQGGLMFSKPDDSQPLINPSDVFRT